MRHLHDTIPFPHAILPTYAIRLFRCSGPCSVHPCYPRHCSQRNDWKRQNEHGSIAYSIGLGLLNATGIAIYAARMHILVTLGALSHTAGLLKAPE